MISVIIGFILGVGAIIFVLQNTATVALSFLGWQFQSSLALVVFLAVALGVLLSALISLPGAIGSGFRMGKLRRENETLRQEAEKYKQTSEDALARLRDAEARLGAAEQAAVRA